MAGGEGVWGVTGPSWLADAEARVRAAEAATGGPDARPVDMLQRYAMGRALRSRSLAGLAPLGGWDPAQVADLLSDFLEDLGHLCDEEGASYEACVHEALGVGVGFVAFPSGLPGNPPRYRADPGGHRSLCAGAAADALVVAYGDGAWTGTHATHAVRHAMRLAEEAGLDAEEAFAMGVGAWASTRDGSEGEIEWTAHPGLA